MPVCEKEAGSVGLVKPPRAVYAMAALVMPSYGDRFHDFLILEPCFRHLSACSEVSGLWKHHVGFFFLILYHGSESDTLW